MRLVGRHLASVFCWPFCFLYFFGGITTSMASLIIALLLSLSSKCFKSFDAKIRHRLIHSSASPDSYHVLPFVPMVRELLPHIYQSSVNFNLHQFHFHNIPWYCVFGTKNESIMPKFLGFQYFFY